MAPARYILACFAAALGLVTALAGFNWYVDPLAYFGRNPFGLYHQDGLPAFKARMLARAAADAVLLGSSNSEIVGPEEVAPWHLGLFNASLLGIMPEDLLYYVDNFVRGQRIVIVAFDFYMVNEGCKPLQEPDFARTSARNLLAHTLSMKVTYYSLRTLRWHRKKTPVLNFPTGNVNREREEAANARATGTAYGNWVEQTRDLFYCRFRYSERRLEMIRELARNLARRDIRLVAYLSPLHPLMLDMLRGEGLADALARWRRDMTAVVPGVTDLTDGPFSAPGFFYWNDPLHYTRATAGRIMERVLGDQLGPPAAAPEPLARRRVLP